jgi:hypothetical protein
MGRKCKGYRDPVAALFRDESKGFVLKRERVTGQKKSPTAASHESSQEIDRALAACSTIFRTSSLNDSDQSCVDSLLSEPLLGPLERSPSVEDQGTCFLDTSYTMDEPEVFNDNFQFMSNMYVCEEARDTLVENVTSLGVAGLKSHAAVSDTIIDSDIRYNMAFIESCCSAGQDHERFIVSDLTAELPNTCDEDSTAIDPKLLDFDRIADPQASTNVALKNITWSLELQAPCYFFANYVLEDTADSKGYLNYLPGLFENEVTSSFLMDAVTSLGLVGLAMRRHDSSALNYARLKYASALNQLNVALTSKAEALTDQALTTVFLLGLYEVNCASRLHFCMLTHLSQDKHLFSPAKLKSMEEAYQWSSSNVAASGQRSTSNIGGTPDICTMARSNCKSNNNLKDTAQTDSNRLRIVSTGGSLSQNLY